MSISPPRATGTEGARREANRHRPRARRADRAGMRQSGGVGCGGTTQARRPGGDERRVRMPRWRRAPARAGFRCAVSQLSGSDRNSLGRENTTAGAGTGRQRHPIAATISLPDGATGSGSSPPRCPNAPHRPVAAARPGRMSLAARPAQASGAVPAPRALPGDARCGGGYPLGGDAHGRPWVSANL